VYRIKAITILSLTLHASVWAQPDGSYSIRKSVVSGGGGTSTGGTYRVRGTAGQPEAGDITGGTYRIAGGFWTPTSAACAVADPVTLEPSPLRKSRYLSIVPGNTGLAVGLRVTLVNVDGFPSANGSTLWVGPPHNYPEEDSSQPGLTFVGAGLQCEPYFADWGTIDVLQVFGAEIAPGSTYDVYAVSQVCYESLDEGAEFGPPTTLHTGKWGDVVPLYDGDDPGAQQPDFKDIAATVAKFQANPAAPIKALAQLQPNVVFPGRALDFRDIAAGVAAFMGTSYAGSIPGSGPCVCPSSVICGANACTSDTQCTPGFCFNGYCTDTCGRCGP